MKTKLKSLLKGILLSIIMISLFSISSCGVTDTIEETPPLSAQERLDEALAKVNQEKLAADLAIIDDTLANAGFTDRVQIGPKGVRYIIDSLGTGAKPTLQNIIQIKYTAKLLNTGAEFDARDLYQTYLYNFIIGFQTALPQISSGSIIRLYVPSGYAYGDTDVKNDASGEVIIPANSNLYFEIELLSVF